MQLEREASAVPPPREVASRAVSLEEFERALTRLVSAMEAELAQSGAIAEESATEVRNLRSKAEQIFFRQ